VLPSALLQSIGRLCPLFEGNQQQDAHELLVTLLTHLQDVKVSCPPPAADPPRPDSQLSHHGADEPPLRPLKPPKKKNQQQNGGSGLSAAAANNSLSHTQQDAVDGIDRATSQQTLDRKEKSSPPPPAAQSKIPAAVPNFVKENFVGVGVMRTKCLECESSTFKKEEFTNIDIPILCDDEEEDSAYNFFISRILASETLRDVNKYWCSECSRLNEAQRTVSYEVLPAVLVLQLKRFTTTASRAYVSKLTDYIPTPLLMDCFCQKCREGAGPPLHRYRLYSVILHLGASLASGHYIACVRAADTSLDYFQCSRPGVTDTAARSKHPKHRGIFKMFSSKSSSSAAPPEQPAFGGGAANPVCGSISCCGLKMNPSLVSAEGSAAANGQPPPPPVVANGHVTESNGASPRYSPGSGGGGGRPESGGSGAASTDQDDIWLECDDEQISVITR
jgi:ubiquitin carboxyl-terminal hydrolase 1